MYIVFYSFIRDQHMRVIEREVRDLRIAFIGSPLVLSSTSTTNSQAAATASTSQPSPPSEVLARLSELSQQMRSLDARLASLSGAPLPSLTSSSTADVDCECCLCAAFARVRRVTVEARREELVAIVTHPLTGVGAAVFAASAVGLVLVLRH